jgi:uncharacterized protein (DUF885 family)
MSGCVGKTDSVSFQLKQIFADEFEYGLKEYPLFATSYGDHRFDDKLAAVSIADSERRVAQQRQFLERLQTLDREALDSEEKVNYDIFKHLTENSIKEYVFQSHLMPISQMGGFHTGFAQLPERIRLDNTKDYENYIARLNGFGAYTAGHIELMRAGVENGFVLPRVVMKDIVGSIKPHIVANANESLLFKPFEKFPKIISQADRQRLTRAGRKAIINSVVPAYQLFLKFMTEEYIPAGRAEISASSLPDGKAYYEHCVRRYTTLDIGPEEVHDIGLHEVKRIRKEMLERIEKTGFEGDFDEFAKFLHTDERFYVDTPEQLLKEVAFVLKRIDGQLPKLFGTFPRMPFGVKEVPDYLALDSAAAYYHRPPADGSRAGFFYVNTYDLNGLPLYVIEALSLHESVPGHHFQIALQQEIKNMPEFRCFSLFGSYSEGWALYAERLGLEMGFYEDPYCDFGRLNFEMWRACRLVVDTGIHYFGWSRQKAIDYLARYTTFDRDYIATEVDRYIVWPGQALSYKMGELKIRELRAIAEQKLGENFDVRKFHNIVLRNGSVPLDVLEDNVNVWLFEQVGE